LPAELKKKRKPPPGPIKMTLPCIDLLFTTKEHGGRVKKGQKSIINLNENLATIILKSKKKKSNTLMQGQ
jgi:hypothetical protein